MFLVTKIFLLSSHDDLSHISVWVVSSNISIDMWWWPWSNIMRSDYTNIVWLLFYENKTLWLNIYWLTWICTAKECNICEFSGYFQCNQCTLSTMIKSIVTWWNALHDHTRIVLKENLHVVLENISTINMYWLIISLSTDLSLSLFSYSRIAIL